MKMRVCPHCGAAMPKKARFCPHCKQKTQAAGRHALKSVLQRPQARGTITRVLSLSSETPRPATTLNVPSTEQPARGADRAHKERRAQPADTSQHLPALARQRPALLWHVVTAITTRAADPYPEKQRVTPQAHSLGWLPALSVTNALGLFIIVIAYNTARASAAGAELYYWLGLSLIFVPSLVRLLLPQATRNERVGLLLSTALSFFLAKVALSPFRFSDYDEFLHWATVNNIMATGHLFTPNPLLPVSPYYPGLEIVTSAISTLSGLSTLQAGYLVAGCACLLMILCLFLLCELLSGSPRLASIAAMIYMTNPHFLFFDSQFAYESLALPLATFVLFVMARCETLNQGRRWLLVVAWLVLVAVDVTHHATNFVFEGLFLLWAIISLSMRPRPSHKSIVVLTSLFGITLTAITVLLIGKTVINYFTSFLADIQTEIANALGNSADQRQLFTTAGTPTPLWELLISLGSVGLITTSIPFLLLCFWQRYCRQPLARVFAIMIIFYPFLQVLRLTSSGAELSDRASAFIFIPISFLAATAIVQFWPLKFFNWKQPALISAALLMLLMGGLILGEGIPPSFLPGPYQVSDDGHSIDPEGIQAARWSYSYLGPGNRVYTDRANQLLASVYGDQYVVTKSADNVAEADIFFETSVNNYVIAKLQAGNVHYLLVDLRLTTAPPVDGFYFEAGEPAEPLTPALLTKFDGAPQINRLFDSGNIAIYDTGELIHAPQKP